MLTAPQNGTISCPLGRTTGSMCTFTCDIGFTLIGSSRRICRTTTAWTGTLTFCRPLQCVPLEPPENGVILAPCRRDYTSTCSIMCTFGYTLEGPRVQTCILDSRSGEVHWTEQPMCIGEFIYSNFFILSARYLQFLISNVRKILDLISFARKFFCAVAITCEGHLQWRDNNLLG